MITISIYFHYIMQNDSKNHDTNRLQAQARQQQVNIQTTNEHDEHQDENLIKSSQKTRNYTMSTKANTATGPTNVSDLTISPPPPCNFQMNGASQMTSTYPLRTPSSSSQSPLFQNNASPNGRQFSLQQPIPQLQMIYVNPQSQSQQHRHFHPPSQHLQQPQPQSCLLLQTSDGNFSAVSNTNDIYSDSKNNNHHQVIISGNVLPSTIPPAPPTTTVAASGASDYNSGYGNNSSANGIPLISQEKSNVFVTVPGPMNSVSGQYMNYQINCPEVHDQLIEQPNKRLKV